MPDTEPFRRLTLIRSISDAAGIHRENSSIYGQPIHPLCAKSVPRADVVRPSTAEVADAYGPSLAIKNAH